MELRDVLTRMMRETLRSAQPAELCAGTVSQASPLEVTLDTGMGPLKEEVLYLTSAVVEKKLPVLEHTHITRRLRHSHEFSGLDHDHETDEGCTSYGLYGTYETETGLEADAYESDKALLKEEIVCYEHGKPLGVKDGWLILNRGLAKGDKVLLLRVQNGQKFVILSRVFEKEGEEHGGDALRRR